MGRPHKGLRVTMSCRLPVAVHRETVARARRQHWPINQVIVEALKAYLRVDEPEVHDGRSLVPIYDEDGTVIGRM